MYLNMLFFVCCLFVIPLILTITLNQLYFTTSFAKHSNGIIPLAMPFSGIHIANVTTFDDIRMETQNRVTVLYE